MSIYTKLAEVMREVERVEKRGHNSFHNYDYVTESDMVEAVRTHLSARGVVCWPQVENVSTIQTEKGILATVEINYHFKDDEGHVMVRVVGAGYDIPGDKAVYKAMTGAQKYALRQLFLIPTGDDPERDSDSQDHAGAKPAGQRLAEPVRHGSNPAKTSASDPVPDRSRTQGGKSSSSFDEKSNTVTFGKNKGKLIQDIDDSGLAWWTEVMEKEIAKKDSKYHKFNVMKLDACQAEWARRQPWRKVWETILALGNESGLDQEAVTLLLKNELEIPQADALKPGDEERFRELLETEQR